MLSFCRPLSPLDYSQAQIGLGPFLSVSNFFCIAAEGKPVTTPEYPMGLPSVVPSAETAKSEAERQEREALANMFSPSSPHDDQHHHAIPGPSGVNEAESRADARDEKAMEDGQVFEEKSDGDKGNVSFVLTTW